MPFDRDIPKSDRILNEIKLLRERDKIKDVDEPMEKIVIFSVAGGLYGLHGREVEEILPLQVINPVPGTPACIPGLITVRGEVESVLDVRTLLGLPAAAQHSGLILLASSGGIRSGVLIDTVEDVADIPLSAILPPPATLGTQVRDYVAGRLDCSGRNVVLLNLATLFARAAVA